MAQAIGESLLRAIVAEARSDDGAPAVLAVRAAPRWDGEEVIETEDGVIRVAPCVSGLAVRDLLNEREVSPNGETLVILTDRDERDLGQEVLARVWRQRLVPPSRWTAAKHLFRVNELDPSLADARWMIDLLVEVAPPRGYPPPPSGLLDFDTAWRTFLRHALRVDVDEPTLTDLLRWASTDDARSALGGSAGKHRDKISERLEHEVGPAAGHVLRLVADGRGGSVVPLGLIADVLWGRHDADDPAVITARVRFEEPLGSRDISAGVATALGHAATRLVRETAARDDEATVNAWLTRAQGLLSDLKVSDLAIVSDVMPWAFTERLLEAGRTLARALDDPREELLESVRDAVLLVERHLRADQPGEAERVERLKMAARLVRRRIDGAAEDWSDLEDMAASYVADGAWVDAARESIGHGESVSSLTHAYQRLIELVDEERAERDRAFGAALAKWSTVLPTEPTPLLPIECVLEHVVAPVARRAPTLLLVLDGLSFAETTRLFADVARLGWAEQGPGGRELPAVVAALPTVTTVSRASLLSGRLTEGGQDVERQGFEEHRDLRDAGGGAAPRLFHKKDLKATHGRTLAPAVQAVVLDPEVRIVGVVVNAVDDHLDKGSQLRLAEGLRALRPLRPLLDAAAEAGRAVIIASDHGHVLEYGSSVRRFAGSGERWRPADQPAGEDEVEIAGPRVVRADGKIVAPVIETIRYMPNEKRGYHGGATPQEVLCPLAVFTSGGVPLAGWEELPVRRPPWWERRFRGALSLSVPRPRRQEAPAEPSGQVMLFTEEGEPAAPSVEVEGWIRELLDSPILDEQRQVAGRKALDDESVATLLAILDRAGGVAPPAVLADATDLPPSRIRSKLQALSSILNVDGYPVLKIELDGTARLNRDLLATQFEVDL